MKRGLIIVILILSLPVVSIAKDKFIISMSGIVLKPSDNKYKEIYRETEIFPELNVGYKIYKNILTWCGYGFLNSSGLTTSLKEKTDLTQNIISAGLGYMGKGKIDISASVGLIYIMWKEKAFGEENSGKSFGYKTSVGGIFRISKNVYLGISAGYFNASNSVRNTSIKHGGLTSGLQLGIIF